MVRDLDVEELRALRTLAAEELKRAGSKRDANALTIAVLLKFFQVHGRFPRGRAEVPDEVVRFVAGQVDVTGSDLGFYEWSGRTIEPHRAEIRDLLGFRECSVADYAAATDWLVQHVTQVERQVEQVRAELLGWLRRQHLEPPGSARLVRIVRSGLDRGERLLIDRICAGLDLTVRGRLNELVFGVPDEAAAEGTDGEIEARDVLVWVKNDPSRLSLNTMLTWPPTSGKRSPFATTPETSPRSGCSTTAFSRASRHPQPDRDPAWTARWNGPIFTLLGLFWLVTIPFTTGSSNATVIRWVLGIAFVLTGVGTTVIYLRDRRREHVTAKASTEAIDSDARD